MPFHLEKLLDWHREKIAAEFASPGKPLESVAIIGAGLMGVEIAAANLHCGVRVVLTDVNSQTLETAPSRIQAELKKYELQGGASQAEPGNKLVGNKLDGLELTTEDRRLAKCDLLLETVVEKLEIKQSIYHRLEPLLATDSIFATNTSTLPIGDLAATLAAPERFCGIHFCHPVSINPLVELISSAKTDRATLAKAVGYVQQLKKLPLVVEDGPGFLVNRLLCRYTDEALHLLMDGAAIEQIDRAAVAFGMAMGPFRILDEIGLDTSLAAGRVLRNAFPDRIAALPILPLLVKRKHLGKKTGAGFYLYPPLMTENEPQTSLGVNPDALELIDHYAKHENPPSKGQILHRLLLAMILEATLILEESKTLDARAIDLCMVCGLGFPTTEGGLLHWADRQSLSKVLEISKTLEPLGPRFTPSASLRNQASKERRFYPDF
jgi:3-hydroxyacyl-CoA dehydrogenase/enoyl-CoA hydratase/3-hydroxybutyryl-CoA epimerase/3-hydroxyacyl-CoA dehydrogenase/enoyl-CoA hydratase/3-hydroxybutyryl-CoA epimerase/enoyl-CoA isomerase